MPFQLDSYETLRVEYDNHDYYHNVKVKSIDSEISGQVTVYFEDIWSFDANPSSRSPIGYGPIVFSGGIPEGCSLKPHVGTVLGKSVKILSDSTWIFDLGNGTSFTIFSQASPGEQWEVFPLLNGSKVVGHMLSIIQGEEPDEWIKTIKLEAAINPLLPSGKFPFHPIVKFSTTRGLLEIPQLSNFKFTPPGYWVDTLPILRYNNWNGNFQESEFRKFNFRKVFDLQPGDIIVSQRNQNGNISRQLIEVLKSEWDSDHSFVNFTWHMKTYNVSAGNEQSLTSDRQVDTTIYKNDFWQSLDSFPPLITIPDSVIENIPKVNAVLVRSNADYYNRRQFYQHYGGLYWRQNAQCYYFNHEPYLNASISEYVEGLGGPYRYGLISGFGGHSITSERIEYYKKGDEEWGDPGVLTSIQNTSIPTNELKIFPTLASSGSEIQIANIVERAHVSLINLQGKLMPFTERISKGGRAIRLTDFKPGVYLVKVSSQEGEYASGKFIVY